MNAKVFETNEVQNLLAAAANLGREDGNARAKEITHRLLSESSAKAPPAPSWKTSAPPPGKSAASWKSAATRRTRASSTRW